ncbi:hypothetical protein SLE2022_225110 [Rubroshorea leprosula]
MAASGRFPIFTYGTLKQGYANHYLMQDLISSDDAVLLGTRLTHHPYPLVVGPYGIPYLINLPEQGHRVRGELYAVSKTGLARLDELEGIAIGHYERLSVQVYEEKSGGLAEAEAYFAHRSFGEKMWEKKRRVGLAEYGETEGEEYVRKQNRPPGTSFLDDIRSFVN